MKKNNSPKLKAIISDIECQFIQLQDLLNQLVSECSESNEPKKRGRPAKQKQQVNNYVEIDPEDKTDDEDDELPIITNISD